MSDGLLSWSAAMRLYTERSQRTRRRELVEGWGGCALFLAFFLLACSLDAWLM